MDNITCSTPADIIILKFSSLTSIQIIFITLLIINIAIIIANFLTLLVIIFKEKKPYDILILCLAAMDISLGVLSLPVSNYIYLDEIYKFNGSLDAQKTQFLVGGQWGCNINGWISFTIKSCSLVILTFIPFDRLFAINFPLWYRERIKLSIIAFIFVLALVFSAIIASIPMIPFISKYKPYGAQMSYCLFEYDNRESFGSRFYSYFVQVFGYGMLIISSLAYILLIIFVLRFFIRKRRYSAETVVVRSTHKKRELVLILKFLLILIIFNICWLPFMISLTLNSLFLDCYFEKLKILIDFIAVRILVINSLLNPVMYVLLMSNYRQGYRVIFGQCFYWLTCCRYQYFKAKKSNRNDYLSKSLHLRGKKLSKSRSFRSEFRKSYQSSKENITMNPDSIICSPKSDLAYYKNTSISSFYISDVGDVFHYLSSPYSSQSVFKSLREFDESKNTLFYSHNDSPSNYTIASESSHRYTYEDMYSDMTPSSSIHCFYSYNLSEQQYIKTILNDNISKTAIPESISIYSGIPGISFQDNSFSIELVDVHNLSYNDSKMHTSISNYKNYTDIDDYDLNMDENTAISNFNVFENECKTKIANTIPHLYVQRQKSADIIDNQLPYYRNRKFDHSFIEIGDKGIILNRVHSLDPRQILKKKFLSRGFSNPITPLNEEILMDRDAPPSNIRNSMSFPFKIAELHNVKISQSNSQISRNRILVTEGDSNPAESTTNISIFSGDTGYSSTKFTQGEKVTNLRRNHSLTNSFREVLGGLSSSVKNKITKTRSTNFADII